MTTSIPTLIPIELVEQTSASVPTPSAGYVSLYAEGSNVKKKDSSGNVETVVSSTSTTANVYNVPVYDATDASAIKASQLSIDDYGFIRGGKIWYDLYDGRFRPALVMPGLGDTLYYGTSRNITVTSSVAPTSGSLDNLFTLDNTQTVWGSVSVSNPIVLEITYPSAVFIGRVDIIHSWRNEEMNDYTIETYDDNDNNGTYAWQTIASVTGNLNYIVSHSCNLWRVKKIRITVTNAGSSGLPGNWNVGTIQATSAVNGKATGHYAVLGSNTFYGDQLFSSGRLKMSDPTYGGIGTLQLPATAASNTYTLPSTGGTLALTTDVQNAGFGVETFSGNGSTTVFNLSLTPITNSVSIFGDNFYLIPGTDFTVSGTAITFTSAPTAGISLTVQYAYTLAATYSNLVIGTTQPTVITPTLWLDTTGGNVTLNLVTP